MDKTKTRKDNKKEEIIQEKKELFKKREGPFVYLSFIMRRTEVFIKSFIITFF